MSISAIGSSSSLLHTAPLQQQAATGAIQATQRQSKNDGDQDDKTVNAATQAATPTVNLSGQTVGGTIHVTA